MYVAIVASGQLYTSNGLKGHTLAFPSLLSPLPLPHTSLIPALSHPPFHLFPLVSL